MLAVLQRLLALRLRALEVVAFSSAANAEMEFEVRGPVDPS
jgi:hypothetical protein